MSENRLEQLLDAWMSRRERGMNVTAAELCAECPELTPELARRIQVVSRFYQLAEDRISETLCSQVAVDTSNLPQTPIAARTGKAPLPGSIGGFRLLSLLGEGGMGSVYLAQDEKLERRVALKVMKSNLAADADARQRFLREARAMATMEHENIMTIYAVGEDQGLPFLVMPVLKGETLDSRLRRSGRISVPETCRIGKEIAAGLAAAHQNRLIHRDIKPSNIWLEGNEGRVRILDFGLARPLSDDHRITQTGAILGTPAYMAPEQAAGGKTSVKSDLFSLGAVLYHMITGQQPFAGPNMMATLHNLANRTPRSPQEVIPEIPQHCSDLINRLLRKSPRERPETAGDVLAALNDKTTESLPDIKTIPRPTGQSSKSILAVSKKMLPTPAASGSHRLHSGRPLAFVIRWRYAGVPGLLLLIVLVAYHSQSETVSTVSIVDRGKAAAHSATTADATTGTGELKRQSAAAVASQSIEEKGQDPSKEVASLNPAVSNGDQTEKNAIEVTAAANAEIPVSPESQPRIPVSESRADSKTTKVDPQQSPEQYSDVTGVAKVEGYEIRLVGACHLTGMSIRSIRDNFLSSAPLVFEQSFNSAKTAYNGPAQAGGSFSTSFEMKQVIPEKSTVTPNLGIALTVSKVDADPTEDRQMAELDANIVAILADGKTADRAGGRDFHVTCSEFERRYPGAEYWYYDVPSEGTGAKIDVVRGVLLLTPLRREVLRFSGLKPQSKRTAKGKRVSIEFQRNEQKELQVIVELPATSTTSKNLPLDENTSDQYMVSMQLEDDEGIRHDPSGVTRVNSKTSFLPFDGKSGFGSGMINFPASAKNGTRPPAIPSMTCTFAPLPSGRSHAAMVVEITERTGRAKPAPFEIIVKTE